MCIRDSRASVDVGLIVPRRPRDVEAVAPAGVPLCPDTVQRKADLRDDIRAQGLLRPGKRAESHKRPLHPAAKNAILNPYWFYDRKKGNVDEDRI